MSLDVFFHNVRSLGGKLAFFRGGWGHVAARRKRHQAWLDAVKNLAVPRPASLDLSVRPHPVVGKEATFTSPCESFLPPESGKGRVWIVDPTVKADDPPPVVVHLAATGDHGFWLRYLLFARHLARKGVQSALLENPLYGARIPSCQRGAKLHTVADLTDMGRATIEECRALLTYFHERGHKRLAAFGLSQGGLHAAMAASLCYDFPVNVVSAIAPASAAPVFTRGVLSTAVDWSSLSSARLEEKGTDVRAALASHLDAVASIRLFPESPSGGRHILLAASDDQYVDGDAVDMWRAARPGIEVRLLDGVGHCTAVALRSNEVRQAIVDSLAPSHW